MRVLAFLAFLAALTGAQRLRNRNGNVSNIQVISAEPRNGTIIRQGDSVRLSCRTNIQWFFCVWKGPGGKKQCAIQERMPQNVCQGDNRITLQGGSNNCDIILKDVKSEDFGNWMCLVTDPVKFNSDKQKIALEVGSPANVKFQRSYGKKNTLVITEGEETEITCEALNAHPAPQLSWVEPKNATVDISAPPQINTYDHTTDIRHTLKYKAQMGDNGGFIKCVGTQVSKDGRTILYEHTAVVKLQVEKLILPIDDALTQKIGIISGVLLSVIFLILICVFVIFAVCKRRRKRSRPPSSTGTDDTTPEDTIKPIWTTPLNGGSHGPPLISRAGHKPPQQAALQTQQTQQQSQQVSSNRSHVIGHHTHMSNTVSQATVSTQSTGSNASWEDRSVGGEIEDSNQRYHMVSKHVTETHFEETDFDLFPRSIIHHPDPFVSQRSQRPSYAGRPSSSMLEQHPMYNQNRPQSALDTPIYYPSRRLPTPNDMTTSVKSVFDCELGCFEEAHEGHDIDSTKASPSKSGTCCQAISSPLTPTSPVSNLSQTSEPKEV